MGPPLMSGRQLVVAAPPPRLTCIGARCTRHDASNSGRLPAGCPSHVLLFPRRCSRTSAGLVRMLLLHSACNFGHCCCCTLHVILATFGAGNSPGNDPSGLWTPPAPRRRRSVATPVMVGSGLPPGQERGCPSARPASSAQYNLSVPRRHEKAGVAALRNNPASGFIGDAGRVVDQVLQEIRAYRERPRRNLSRKAKLHHRPH
jgi:hypothetical protein